MREVRKDVAVVTDSKPQKPRLPWVLLWLDAIDEHPNVWAFGVGTGAVMGFVMGLAW